MDAQDTPSMSLKVAKVLGYEFELTSGQSYVTATGQMNTKFQMTVDGICLPHLSHHRTFSATFEIAPEESGDFGFRVIMGIDMMDDLGINTSQTTKTIIWGNDIKVLMVSKSYWTEACIRALCGTVQRKPSEVPTSHNITSKPDTLAKEESSLFRAESEPAQPTSSFTKAVYVKPDLLEAVKCNGVDLTTNQQALLFKTLSDHNAVFQGDKGRYTGKPVKIRLKPDAVPKRAKPYDIPVKDRKVVEDGFSRQCKIRALHRLSPEE
jgi:hypothetical protein